MSLSIATLKLLQEAGVPAERLLEIADAIQRDFEKPQRSNGAKRQAEYRERVKAKKLGVTPTVTNDVTRDATSDEQVTSPSQFPLQREYLPLVEFDYGLSNASTRDEREHAQRELRNRTGELIEAVKRQVNGTADWSRYNMQDMSTFIRLMAPTEGEPVRWSDDLAPALKTAVAQHKSKGKPLTTWNYVVPIALRNRDERIKPLPPVESNHGRHQPPSTSSGYRAGRGRGQSPDIVDQAFARLGGFQADPDIIDHPVIIDARRAS